MTDHQRSVRVGVAAIVCAVVFRLGMSPVPKILAHKLSQWNIDSRVIYLETGQDVRFSASMEAFSGDYPGESPAPILPEPELPYFCDAEGLQITYFARKDPDLDALIRKPLTWDLMDGISGVLILSTHTTESYTKTDESYEESAAWRTLDEGFNMLSVGDRVEEILSAAGIRVVRDRELHDYPSYNGSYTHAREAMAEILAQDPGILLVLDLHRDAVDAPGGGQLRPLVTVGNQKIAQLMVVLGVNYDHWEENLSLGLKLMAQLERQIPGITRPLLLRQSRFNQDLSPGALLIEVGAAGNTRREALAAAEELAGAIIALAKGTAEQIAD